ncbi:MULTISPECIES: radical SAM protein [unclassified Ruminococcus]|uniref:B12-binding domain-containing radical SAM protein n=1 Tax=unclassified Ruminococcus TaxID=2608920 RepID=UPI00210D4705|nr:MULTISPECIES: radical SAM protein [unclassified Ruminococcus]MCQ4023205.1 radical SAM protein [Ruminococcus sp. zg-924]MCQ4115423.1 radical SAM protein [Ruminococcus sp. zg-921]
MKIRFIEPGNRPYRKSIINYAVYDRYIRTPSVGLNTLATIVKRKISDTYMYSESISKIDMSDVLDADIIFMGFFTYAAIRGYELANYFRQNSRAVIVLGGLHASMNYEEAVRYCDYVMLGEGDETILPLIDAIKNNKKPDFKGVAWIEQGKITSTGIPNPPVNIDIIPDRSLIHNYQKMTGHMTIWPQVHASRGCPHNCDYCALVRHFGRKVRTRTPQNVVDDIKYSIDFFHKKHFRLFKDLWITDDNFFADRQWAKAVLNAIIDSGIKYRFNIQIRYEVGFDDEILDLLKKAGFFELDMGIEFVDDESFSTYHKKSTVNEIEDSIRNIQKHGLSVRGLFILGSDNQKKGCGKALADFVIKNKIQGVLIQCMYFVPGTPAYEQNKERLLHRRWDKYNGNTVHRPKNMTPYELQLEHIDASKRIYSVKRLVKALIFEDAVHKALFLGEYLWHWSVRHDLKKELKNLPN